MNPTRFDDLTKALAAATSRRQALKAIGAALGGALGFISSIGIANAANCKDAGHQCAKNQDCCSNICCAATCCAIGAFCDKDYHHCG